MRMEELEEELMEELTITVIMIRSACAVLPVHSTQKMAIPLRSVARSTPAVEIML